MFGHAQHDQHDQGAPKAREAKRANVRKLRFDADFENEATKCMVLLHSDPGQGINDKI